RNLLLVRRNAQRVVSDARERGEGGAEAGADVEDAGGRGGEPREKEAGGAILRVDDRLAVALENAVVEIRDASLLMREDVHENVERIVEVAVEGQLQARLYA